jgi:carbon monoxide dehydrogenase subunit G
MAMTMNGEAVLPADRKKVWVALNDPEVLKACIPGCQELDKVSDTEFQATVRAAVGPVKATFKGRVQLLDLDPPNGYRIAGEGQGGVAGFAKGGANVRLEDAEGGTRMTYDVEAQIGGKLAQLGGRLINGVAKKYADEFFANSPSSSPPKAPLNAPEGRAAPGGESLDRRFGAVHIRFRRDCAACLKRAVPTRNPPPETAKRRAGRRCRPMRRQPEWPPSA